MKKALWICYDIAIDDEIIEFLDSFGIIGFTRWPRLSGRGPKSGARLDNHVWPGANAAVVTVQEDELIQKLLPHLQALRRETGPHTGLWAFTTPVLDVLD